MAPPTEQHPEPTEITIYPNPTRDIIILDAPLEESEEINNIYLVDSRMIKIQVEPKQKGTRRIIDVNQLSAGIYYLVIERTGKRKVVKKFVKVVE